MHSRLAHHVLKEFVPRKKTESQKARVQGGREAPPPSLTPVSRYVCIIFRKNGQTSETCSKLMSENLFARSLDAFTLLKVSLQWHIRTFDGSSHGLHERPWGPHLKRF